MATAVDDSADVRRVHWWSAIDGYEGWAGFDVHTTGHGHAISVSGWPVLMGLDGMKKAQK